MVGSIAKSLVDAFTDGDAGHDDDELAPAVALVELEHGLDVAVCFASAGFHLDIEVDGGYGGALESRGDWEVLGLLDRLDVFEDRGEREGEVVVFDAGLFCLGAQCFGNQHLPGWRLPVQLARVDAVGDASVERLTREAIY